MIRTLILALALIAGIAPAIAQTKQVPRLFQPRTDAAAAPSGTQRGGLLSRLGGDDDSDLLSALEAKLLPDLKFALNIARANGNDLTGDCWAAWIAMIEARQKANVDEQGNAIEMPDPAVITKFQKLVDIRNALQPTSPFMRSCSPLVTMVKSDIRKFIGMILTGGFGLAALGVGL